MDAQKFTDAKTGRLVAIPHPRRPTGTDWAFVPDRLPPTWEFPGDLWPLLRDAHSALSKLDGIGEFLPNPQLLLKPLQRREAISSSGIEGTHVTPQQLMLFELDPREVRSTDELSTEEQAVDWVFSYGEALRHGFCLLGKLPMCHRVICEMHEVLMRGVRAADNTPGLYRTLPVEILSGNRFIPPPAAEVRGLMDDFEHFMNNRPPRFDPLIFAFIMHYQFEAIHPYSDGNGRIGRALLALMIQQWLGHKMPWLYLSAYFERYEDTYENLLFRVSAEGAWREWVEFCLCGTVAQANDSIARCRLFLRLKDSYASRVKPTPRIDRIIADLFSSPVLTVTSLMAKFGKTYHTMKGDAERLVEAGILREIPGIYPRSFFAWEVVAAAFSDDPEKHAHQVTKSDDSIETEPPGVQSETAAPC
jgi:Fic family protein